MPIEAIRTWNELSDEQIRTSVSAMKRIIKDGQSFIVLSQETPTVIPEQLFLDAMEVYLTNRNI